MGLIVESTHRCDRCGTTLVKVEGSDYYMDYCLHPPYGWKIGIDFIKEEHGGKDNDLLYCHDCVEWYEQSGKNMHAAMLYRIGWLREANEE